MKLIREHYDLNYSIKWDNEAEELRARALNPVTEVLFMQRINELRSAIVSEAVNEPGDAGEIRKENLAMLQGKLQAYQEILLDSQEAHTKISIPNN